MNSKILNIANFFTILNLLCGLIAIVFFSNGLVNFGCLFIIFASFFDFLDGYFARKLNISSDFGKQADSLSDMISFGVAPAILLSINNCISNEHKNDNNDNYNQNAKQSE